MNLHEQKYLTGASDLDRVIHARRGRRVVVLDLVRRRRQAIRMMLAQGHQVRDISRVLGCPESLVSREKKDRIISDFMLTTA